MKGKIITLALLLALTLGAGPVSAESAPINAREILATAGSRSVPLTLAIFSSRDYALRVIDNAAARDTGKFPRLRMAMKATGATAGCNGSFFNQHPFDPVGLMIADSVHAGTFDPKSWMQGLVVVRHGELRFEPAETFQDAPDVTQLIQTGPWLVQNATAVISTDARRAHRTFICRDATGNWALGATREPCTLGQLGAALRSAEVVAALDVQTALNFDGGPSTGLWVRGDDGDYSIPDQWTVRNYVGIFPRTNPRSR